MDPSPSLPEVVRLLLTSFWSVLSMGESTYSTGVAGFNLFITWRSVSKGIEMVVIISANRISLIGWKVF